MSPGITKRRKERKKEDEQTRGERENMGKILEKCQQNVTAGAKHEEALGKMRKRICFISWRERETNSNLCD